ncbi:LysM domain-containing protein [Chloroflexota bacterium]
MARQYGTTSQRLVRVNRLADPNVVFVG